ncbi:hypothetical protein H8959_015349 [Pygathrix nigripes]
MAQARLCGCLGVLGCCVLAVPRAVSAPAASGLDGGGWSNWLKPCCGKRAAVWQVFLLSASLNSFLVACVILVVILLTLELLIDIKLLQFSSAFQFAGVIHWISLVILSVFFSEVRRDCGLVTSFVG